MTIKGLSSRVLGLVLTCSLLLTINVDAADVLIVGDSMMKSVARALKKECAKRTLSTETVTSIGSGLARLDLLDWHREMRSLISTNTPKCVFVMMGTNDNQAMKTEGGTIAFGGAGWDMEYGRRAGKLMDILIDGGVSKVVWIGLPCMREAGFDSDLKAIGRIVDHQAAARSQVRFVSTYRRFSKKGRYSAYIIQASGMPLDVRTADGIHLNRNGAELLAKLVISECKNN